MTVPYKKITDLDPMTALTDADVMLSTDVAAGRSKKLTFSLLKSTLQNVLQLISDKILNNSTVPGTTLTDALDYLLSHGGGGGIAFEPAVEMIALTPLDIVKGYISLAHIPFNLTHVRMELVTGQLQINKKAISPASGPLTPNFEMDANLKTRLYFVNVPANYGNEGNEQHSGLSEGFTDGQVFVVSYLYKI